MKKLVLLAALAMTVAGCQSDSQRDRALVGGGLGAATGAVVGSAIDGGGLGAATGAVVGSAIDGGGAGGAIAGAVIGGLGGAAIGSATTPKNCVAYDRYGNPYRVVCP